MILAIAYCHRDIEQALKLMRWIGWLSEKDGRLMLRERCLLVCGRVASKLPQHEQIKSTAKNIFGNVTVHVPEKEDERPWPRAANFMFQEALSFEEPAFERCMDDMLWLEPDAIPTRTPWFSELRKEWEEIARPAGKHFMGALVPNPRHMSGVAIYGREWRAHAPKLINISNGSAWDVNSADQVLPLAHITDKIVHKFGRRRPFTPSLELIPRDACIFHQDKKGLLIDMLNVRDYGGRAMLENADDAPMNTLCFFHSENASAPLKASGLAIRFEPYRFFAGVHKGVFHTSDPVECVVLSTLTNSPTSGITEIDQVTYEKHTRKKFIPELPDDQSEWHPPSPPIFFPSIYHSNERTVIHAVERHKIKDADNRRRILNAFNSWVSIYKGCKQVKPLHIWEWQYRRNSIALGDKRAMPYLKDILKSAMDVAKDRKAIVMLTNDDSILHPELPSVIDKLIDRKPAFSSFRVNFEVESPPDFSLPLKQLIKPSDGDIGRDLFVFTVDWLFQNWNNIPDFLLGELEWDLVLAMIIRKSYGLQCSGKTIGKVEPMCELPMGYVWHERHDRPWTKAGFYDPSKQHNWKSASDWCAKNGIGYPFG